MERLWERMTTIYGHRWTSAYGTTDDGTWLQGLAGVTPEQIRAGIGRCLERGDGWPPTLPEFRALCLDGAAGLPPVDRAYREACEGSGRPADHDWSHPAVYVAARDAGFWSLRREPSRTTWPAFRRAYEDACRRVQAGEDLSGEVMAALPQTPAHVDPADRDTARSRLDGMRAALRGRQDPADAAAEWERLNAPRGQLQRPNNDCAAGEGTE